MPYDRNDRLRSYRVHRGWSQDDVARELIALGHEVGEANLGVSGSAVGRWERGENRPRAPYPKLLCMLFGATAKDLGLSEPVLTSPPCADCATLDDDMERRTVLRLLGVATSGAALRTALPPGLRSPAATLPVPTEGRGPAAAEAVTSITGQYRKLEAVTAAGSLLEPVLGHLRFVSRVVEKADSTRARADLAAAASEIAGFAGWLAYDVNDQPAALRYYQTAVAYAGQSGSKLLHAYMVGSMSLWATATDGAEAIRLAERAKTIMPSNAPTAARAWAATVEASAYASVGNVSASLAALRRAEEDVEAGGSCNEPSWPWVYPFDLTKVLAYRGSCAARLELPHVALPALQGALGAMEPSTKQRALSLADLAMTYTLTGEVEQACHSLSDAFAIGVQKDSAKVIERVREVRLRLSPWRGTPAIKQLDERLLSAYLHPC